MAATVALRALLRVHAFSVSNRAGARTSPDADISACAR